MASLRSLIESALSTYLEGSGATATFHQGIAAAAKDGPAVISRAVSAEEDPLTSGNYRVTCSISVRANAPDGTAAFDELAEAIRDRLWVDDLAAQLASSVTGLTVWGVAAPHRVEWDTDEDALIENHTVEVYAAATDFS